MIYFTAGKNNEWYKTHIRSLITILVHGCVQNNHLKMQAHFCQQHPFFTGHDHDTMDYRKFENVYSSSR